MGLVFFSLMFGVAASIADPLIISVLIGLFGSFVMLFFPNLLLWIIVLGGLVIAGVLEIYLPTLQILRWGFAGASMLLLVAVLFRDYIFARPVPGHREAALPAIFLWALAFLALCVITTILNWVSIGHTLFGWKGYFQLWGLFLSLALARQTPTLFRRAPGLLLGIAFLQLPFVAQQFVILVPARKGLPGIVPAGASSLAPLAAVHWWWCQYVLALYLLSVIAVLIALWRSGALAGRRWLLSAAGLLMPPLFLNESKASMVLLVVSFLVIFRKDIRLHPIRFAGISLALATLLVALLFSYTMISDRAVNKDPIYYLEHAIEQNVSEGYRYGAYNLNRVTALKFWAEERHRYGVKELLIGHGLGESRDQVGAIDLARDTLASVRYRGVGIGISSVSGLIWEVGLIGAFVVVAMFLSAFRLAGRLAQQGRTTWEQGWFSDLQAVVAMFALSLLHNNFFLFHFEYQVFLLLLSGYLTHTARYPRDVTGLHPLPVKLQGTS